MSNKNKINEGMFSDVTVHVLCSYASCFHQRKAPETGYVSNFSEMVSLRRALTGLSNKSCNSSEAHTGPHRGVLRLRKKPPSAVHGSCQAVAPSSGFCQGLPRPLGLAWRAKQGLGLSPHLLPQQDTRVHSAAHACTQDKGLPED